MVGYDSTYKLYTTEIEGKTDVDKSVLLDILNKSLSTLDLLRNSLHDTLDMLDNSITSSTFDLGTLGNYKNQTSTMISSLEQVILSPT